MSIDDKLWGILPKLMNGQNFMEGDEDLEEEIRKAIAEIKKAFIPEEKKVSIDKKLRQIIRIRCKNITEMYIDSKWKEEFLARATPEIDVFISDIKQMFIDELPDPWEDAPEDSTALGYIDGRIEYNKEIKQKLEG